MNTKQETLIATSLETAAGLAAQRTDGATRNILRAIAQGATGTNAPDCLHHLNTMGEAGQGLIDAWLPVDFAQHANQKAIMRALEAFAFSVTGSGFQPITGGIIAAMLLTGENRISYETMRHTMGERGIIDPVPMKGVSQYQLRNIIKRFGLKKSGEQMTKGTIRSQVSRTIGVHGLLSAMGITRKVDSTYIEVEETGRAHPFVLAYASQMQALTDGDLGLIEG